MDLLKSLRHPGACFRKVRDVDRQQKHHVVCHIERALRGLAPLAPEIAFLPGLSGVGNNRHEIIALSNPSSNFLVPCIAASELIFVIPNVDAVRA